LQAFFLKKKYELEFFYRFLSSYRGTVVVSHRESGGDCSWLIGILEVLVTRGFLEAIYDLGREWSNIVG